MSVLGWDIGGVNTKVALVADRAVVSVRNRAFELQRAPASLVPILQELAADLGAPSDARHAVTMTAELSQMFRSKREGVAFVLNAIEAAFPGAAIQALTVDGRFVDIAHAVGDPLSAAAANWAATANIVARSYRDALLIDIGTTTTDIIPIAGGRVLARGRTDPERLASGELVYTGAVRTAVEAITSQVPLGDGSASVSAEAFALAGDVHVWRGALAPEAYNAPTPDGRPVTREFVGERLARIVCADREMLDDEAISAIANAVAAAQVARIAEAIGQVIARHPSLHMAIVTGVGDFIAEQAARRAGLEVVHLARELGDAAARCAPAAAVALLLEADLTRSARNEKANVDLTRSALREKPAADATRSAPPARASAVDLVVKVGGALLAFPEHLDRTLGAIAQIACGARVLIVPGGGPFADTVRQVDRRVGLPDDTANWMAVMGMDQYAHVLASRIANANIVEMAGEIAEVLGRKRLPVLAPSRWLRASDPLPHSWDVTSDSIAAWFATAVGARTLVLVKPPRATGIRLVDAYFERARSADVEVKIVTADQLDASVLIAAIMRLRATVR